MVIFNLHISLVQLMIRSTMQSDAPGKVPTSCESATVRNTLLLPDHSSWHSEQVIRTVATSIAHIWTHPFTISTLTIKSSVMVINSNTHSVCVWDCTLHWIWSINSIATIYCIARIIEESAYDYWIIERGRRGYFVVTPIIVNILLWKRQL